jgi:hypothetical protein
MPFHVYAEFAEACHHAGVLGGRRQVTTPVATVKALAHEFRPQGCRAPTMYDPQVFVATHGNPRADIGKDIR